MSVVRGAFQSSMKRQWRKMLITWNFHYGDISNYSEWYCCSHFSDVKSSAAVSSAEGSATWARCLWGTPNLSHTDSWAHWYLCTRPFEHTGFGTLRLGHTRTCPSVTRARSMRHFALSWHSEWGENPFLRLVWVTPANTDSVGSTGINLGEDGGCIPSWILEWG